MMRLGEYQFTLKYFHSGSGMLLKLKTLWDNEEQILPIAMYYIIGEKKKSN